LPIIYFVYLCISFIYYEHIKNFEANRPIKTFFKKSAKCDKK